MVFTAYTGDNYASFTETAAAAGIIESIQQVEFTIASGAATGTGTISSVTTGNTAVFFDYNIFGGQRQSSTERGVDHTSVRVDLTNATTVTATRDTSQTFVITIICTVVEYKSTAVDSIQQGTVAVIATGTDTITSVDTSRSVVIHNGVSIDFTGAQPGRSFTSLSLTNATTVTGTRDNSVNTATTGYVVIEFASGVTDSVQEFSISITSDVATTNTATITSVNTSQSVIFPAGQRPNGTDPALHTQSCYVELTNGTTVTATRNTAATPNPTIVGTIVEFAAANVNSVQRSTVTMASGDTTKDVTVTSVDTSLSIVTALSCTSTSTSAIAPEQQHFTAEILNATTLRFTKDTTGRDVILSWELLEYT